jgi:hypothetical protein
VAREAELPQHSEKRFFRNRVKGFDEVDKQRPRFQSVLFPLGEPNEGGEQPVHRTPVPPKTHLSVKAKLFRHEPHARYNDRREDLRSAEADASGRSFALPSTQVSAVGLRLRQNMLTLAACLK